MPPRNARELDRGLQDLILLVDDYCVNETRSLVRSGIAETFRTTRTEFFGGFVPKIVIELDTANRHADDVINSNRFLHDTRLAVGGPDEVPIEAGHRGQSLTHFAVRWEESSRRSRIAVLRSVAE
jgi:hypothetical protein